MAKSLTKKELVSAYKELDKEIGIEPPIEYDELSLEEFEKELYDTVTELVEEGDTFTKATQAVFDALNAKYGDETEEEETEDDEQEENEEDDEEETEDEDDEEEVEDDEDEDDEEEDLTALVKSTPKRDALLALLKERDEFKKVRKALANEKNVFTLKKQMLKALEGVTPVAEEKPVQKGKVTEKEKPAKKTKEIVEEPEEETNPLIDEINEFEDRDDLLLFVKENKESFKGIVTKDFPTFKKLKVALLEHLGVKTKIKGTHIVKNPCTLPRNVGVIATIKKILEDAGKEGVSRQDILKKLAKKFPDRPTEGMIKTVTAQVPGQLTVHGFAVIKNKAGLYVKK
jgi:hypothetical protein